MFPCNPVITIHYIYDIEHSQPFFQRFQNSNIPSICLAITEQNSKKIRNLSTPIFGIIFAIFYTKDYV